MFCANAMSSCSCGACIDASSLCCFLLIPHSKPFNCWCSSYVISPAPFFVLVGTNLCVYFCSLLSPEFSSLKAVLFPFPCLYTSKFLSYFSCKNILCARRLYTFVGLCVGPMQVVQKKGPKTALQGPERGAQDRSRGSQDRPQRATRQPRTELQNRYLKIPVS